MKYEILLQEEAIADIQQAYSWYNEISLQSAANFKAEIEHSFNHLKSGIADYREVLPGVRVFPFSNFPYNIYYKKVDEKRLIQIIAFLHTRRNSDYVLERLSGA